MHSKDIPTLKGPLHALLWEQWRMTRPVLLLPVVVALADAGLYFWCRVAMEMREDQFVGLANWYIGGLCILLTLLLLCHPDRRLEMRLVTTPRLKRLPVPPRQLFYTSFPLRLLLGWLTVFAALTLHRAIFPSAFGGAEAFGLSLKFALCFVFLYSVAGVDSDWGDRAAVVALTGALGFVVLMAVIIANEPDLPLWPLLLFSVGIMGVTRLSPSLRRYQNGGLGLSMSLPSRKSVRRSAEIPRFESPLEAQRWYERRRRGWALPVLMTLVVLAQAAGLWWQSGWKRLYIDDMFQSLTLYSLALLPAVALLITAVSALLDYRLFRSPEGRFLFARPVPSSLFAQARMRMHAAWIAASIGWVIVLACLLLSLALVAIPTLGFLLGSWSPNWAPINLEGVVLLLAALSVPAMAWSFFFLFNRFTVLCFIIGGTVLGILNFTLGLDFERVSFIVAAVTLMVAAGWNLLIGARAGLLRPWPVLSLLLLFPLASLLTATEVRGSGESFWFLSLLISLPLLAVTGAPIGWHLWRSASLRPLPLDQRRKNGLAWKAALLRVGAVAGVLLAVLGLHHIGIARSASLALRQADEIVALIPREARPVNHALINAALQSGEQLVARVEEWEARCPRVFTPQGAEVYQWYWCDEQLAWMAQQLDRALTALEDANANPRDLGPEWGKALKPNYESDDKARGNRQRHMMMLDFPNHGLLSKALANAKVGETESATNILLTVFALMDACNAAPFPAEVDRVALGNAMQVNDVLAVGRFSKEQLESLHARLPGPLNLELAFRWYADDLKMAQQFPDLSGSRLGWVELSPHFLLWYRVFGLAGWDQIAVAGTVQTQAEFLADQVLATEHARGMREPSVLARRIWLGEDETYDGSARVNKVARYTGFEWAKKDAERLRLMLALRRFAADHDSQLPDKLDVNLLRPYLLERDTQYLSKFSYVRLDPDRAGLTQYDGGRLEIQIPQEAAP